MIQYDGSSLVPDFDQPLRLLFAAGQQRQADQREKARTDEVGALGDKLTQSEGYARSQAPSGTFSRTEFLTRPENVKILQRMARLDPQAAQFALGMAQTNDASHLEAAKRDSDHATRVFEAILDTKDPAERNRFIGTTIRELEDEGKDASKMREMIGMKPDQQSLFARRQVILAGDARSLADSSMKSLQESLRVQGLQLDNMKKAQDVGKAEVEQRDKADAVTRANQGAVDQAQTVNSQIDQVLAALPGASTGRTGQIAAWLSPTGDTANKANKIETLKSMLAIDKLMELKRNSPTGASGFGALSEKELAVIQNSLANLNPAQSDEKLAEELEKIRTSFSGISERAGGPKLVPQAPKVVEPKQVGRFVVRERPSP